MGKTPQVERFSNSVDRIHTMKTDEMAHSEHQSVNALVVDAMNRVNPGLDVLAFQFVRAQT
jgi:hypothetical protein